MVVLVIGGSGSGKSEYAEEYIITRFPGRKKYYIATMQVIDREGQAKIERHRKLRSGKGFLTIEQPVSIEQALSKMERLPEAENIALLECMSNLVANEMFSTKTPRPCEQVTERIMQGIRALDEGLKHLVIVTNNVFEDGILYDETTLEYMRAMGNVNERLAVMADRVIEVVAGIPVTIKERK